MYIIAINHSFRHFYPTDFFVTVFCLNDRFHIVPVAWTGLPFPYGIPASSHQPGTGYLSTRLRVSATWTH
jgi:hypothetical protein